MRMKTLLFRPHHGLCLPFFIGKGYSGEFVENMKKVGAKLEREPETLLKLHVGPDRICTACPNFLESGCRSGPKPVEYDRKCLSACCLQEGALLSWCEYRVRLRHSILKSMDSFSEVCSDCRWFFICQQLYVENLSKELKTVK